jgi:phosphatidylserine/phosphatidylglycerophosphate/cardiolipin synthase-like enzyme
MRETEYPEQGHDDWFPEKMGEIMSRTEVWCDVMSLAPPDGLFMTQVQEALVKIAVRAAEKEKPVIVRMMFGNIPAMPVNCNKLIKEITKNLPDDANIHLWVGAWRRGASWNHAKIIAVDGKYLHTGGHNMWTKHYLNHKPVHDLSLEMEGRVANDGHRFANKQWAFIKYKQDTPCGQLVDKLPDSMILVAKTRVAISEFPKGKAGEYAPLYSKSLVGQTSQDEGDGHVPIITMGRYGAVLRYARPSDDAFVAMLGSAKKIVRLALQDLGPVCVPSTKLPLPGCVWPKIYISTLARVIFERGVDVEIALSNPSSIPGSCKATEACYGNGWSCVDVAAEIIKSIRQQFPDADDGKLRKIVAENLRVCFIRQKRGNKYDDGMTIGMHAKHFIVDDICTYIGSQNLYVCDLAEWGVAIDNEQQTKKLMEEYWNPMWKASFTGEDCDVDAVMDGLDIDRDTDATSSPDIKIVNTAAMQAQGALNTKYVEVDEEKKE